MSHSLLVPAIPSFALQLGAISLAIPFIAPPVWFGIKGAYSAWNNSGEQDNKLLNASIGLIKGIGKGILTDLIGLGFLAGTAALVTISPPLFLAATASIFTFASVSIANSISDTIGLDSNVKTTKSNNSSKIKNVNEPAAFQNIAQEIYYANPFNPNLAETQAIAATKEEPKPIIASKSSISEPTQDIKQAAKDLAKNVKTVTEFVNNARAERSFAERVDPERSKAARNPSK